MSKKRVRPSLVHTHLFARVEDYHVRSHTGINMNFRMPRPFEDCEGEPAVVAETWLEIRSTLTHPADRAGQTIEVSVWGSEAPRVRATLSDYQARNDYGSPVYREYRGTRQPVYESPKGIALLDASRPKGRWSASIPVNPRLVSDWLTILSWDRLLFLAIHEMKAGRARWLQGVSLQTRDPAEE